MIWTRRPPPRYGRGWMQRIFEGVQQVYRPGDTLVVAPRLFLQRFHTIVLFNHREAPLTVSLRFRWPDGSTRVDVDVPAGGARTFTPQDAGSERSDLFSACDRILVEVRAGGPCASTYFLSNAQLHVFFMDGRDRQALGDVVRRYASHDFTLLQGAYQPSSEAAFPDHDDAQRRLYEHARRRFPESMRRLFAPGFALPEAGQIPRSLQWIWLKNPDAVRVTETHVRMMHSWASHNPGFVLNLWTDFPDVRSACAGRAARTLVRELLGPRLRVRGPAEIDALFRQSPLPNAGRLHDLFREAENPAPRSDVLRLMILAAEGGVYSDLNDTECLAPIHEHCARFSFMVGLDNRNRIQNAVLGSARGHALVHEWLSAVQMTAATLNGELARTADPDQYFFVILRACGPYTLTHRLCALLDGDQVGPDVLLLPFQFFHNPHLDQPTPLSLVTHHSAMSWVPKEPALKASTFLVKHFVRRHLPRSVS